MVLAVLPMVELVGVAEGVHDGLEDRLQNLGVAIYTGVAGRLPYFYNTPKLPYICLIFHSYICLIFLGTDHKINCNCLISLPMPYFFTIINMHITILPMAIPVISPMTFENSGLERNQRPIRILLYVRPRVYFPAIYHIERKSEIK